MLTLKQVNDVCLRGQGSQQCRFLAEDNNGFYCLKKTFRKDHINEEVDIFLERQKKNGIDPYSLGIPVGDNCSGYIFLRHANQGYDI